MPTHYEVTWSSKDRKGVFIVHTPNGKIEFVCHPWGLHYLNMSKPHSAEVIVAMMLQEQFKGYTKRQIKDAKKPDAFMVCWGIHQKYNTTICYVKNDDKLPSNSNQHDNFLQNIWPKPCRIKGEDNSPGTIPYKTWIH